jgi:hypothetical protein
MYFLFSGEGATDLGEGVPGAEIAEGGHFHHGPMAVMADQIVENRQGYSPLETGHHGYVSEYELTARAAELKAVKKSVRLPGPKQPKETRYFFNNARVLARIAKAKATLLKDEVVAVLFRDSDGTASAGRGLWQEKRESMLHGFEEEGFSKGVPMIPKPKSEAWLLCALRKNPYQDCEALENRSGNDNSPNSLKSELEELLGAAPTREGLRDMVQNRIVDVERLRMPSFDAFRARLEEVI